MHKAVRACGGRMETLSTFLGADARAVMAVADCFPPVVCPKRYASYVGRGVHASGEALSPTDQGGDISWY